MAELPDRMQPDPQHLRASDADRERVAEILRRAAGEGRLGLDELEERLGVVYAARTYAELEPVTHDLPAHGGPSPVVRTAPAGARTSGGAVAVLGGFERKGPWHAPSRFTCLAFMGGGDIDLRQAQFTDGEITVRAFAVMGGVSITVPEDAVVHVGGVGIMGGFDQRATGTGQPGGPRINVTGVAFWGGVEVKRLPSDEEIKRRKLERKRQRAERRRIDS
jgi:hypothetical protein